MDDSIHLLDLFYVMGPLPRVLPQDLSQIMILCAILGLGKIMDGLKLDLLIHSHDPVRY